MDLLNQMRESFPKTIDKTKPVFSSIIANENNNGALQKQLIDLFSYMKEWTSTADIYKQTGEMLMKTVTFFSFIERFADETEKSLKNRFSAIFVRNHDQRWGTPFDIKNVFRQYFPHATIYLVENTNKIDATEPGLGNLLADGDIETDTPADWTLSNCAATKAARFSKSYGIEMDNSGGYFYQEITDLPNREQIPESDPAEYRHFTYFLHFFMSGKVNVRIQDTTNNKYWDNTSKSWESSEVDNTFSQAEWDDCSLYFITEGTSDTINLKITFCYPDTLLPARLEKTNVKGLIPVTWTDENCSTMTEDNRTVIKLQQADSKVSSTINIAGGETYKLQFSYRVDSTVIFNPNKIFVIVKNNANKYWNFETQQWVDSLYRNPYTATTWVTTTQKIIAGVSDTSFTISFEYGDAASYLDSKINFDGLIPSTRTLTDCTETNGVITMPVKTSKANYVTSVKPDETYKLNFYFKGRLSIVVKNDNNEYWDFTSYTWKPSLYSNEFFVNDRTLKELEIKADAHTNQFTIDYVMIPNYLDYFRLFKKQPFGSFTIITHFEGDTASNVFGLAAGEADPNIPDAGDTPPQPRYGRYGYYDKSYLSGVPAGFAMDIYEDLLDYLRSQGVKAYFNIVIKDINI